MSEFRELIPPDYGEDTFNIREKGLTVGVYGGKFLPPHRGHIATALRAASMVDILFIAVQYDTVYEKEICGSEEFALHPRQRVAWLSEEFANFPNIRVLAQYEHRCSDYLTNSELAETYSELLQSVGGKIDKVFSSDKSYDNYFKTWLPDSEHVVIDADRSVVPISATDIRTGGVRKHWNDLPDSVRKTFQKRVVFAGWESAGKSYIAEAVSKIVDGKYLPEYGREYYDRKGGYLSVATPKDYPEIAAGHLHQLQCAGSQSEIVCVDTDLIYTQFYHQEEFGSLHPVLDVMIKDCAENPYATLFFEPHNSLTQDGSRMLLDQNARNEKSERLKELYKQYGREIIIVDETDRHKRLMKAVEIIQGL